MARAAEILRGGGVVAFPTETVYGLGADATNLAAVHRVFDIKGRPHGHPVIVHLAEISQLPLWARTIPESARVLAERFWPGPLTLVFERAALASDAITGGQSTVAVRVPSHPVARAILSAAGRGVVAPSANRFGHVSATTATHVAYDLGDSVDLIVDAGPATVGVESTIVDVSRGEPAILRHGGVTREQIESALGIPVGEGDGSVRAPGTLASHYAPRASVELFETAEAAHARAAELRSAAIRFAVVGDGDAPDALARDLYARLRAADAEGAGTILVVQPPDTGIGRALRDRLRRAAATDS